MTEIHINKEAETRGKFIEHIMNGKFDNGDFHRYSIEVVQGDKLVTTRIVKDMGDFNISFVLQENSSGSWEDISGVEYIEFVSGKETEIEEIITETVFSDIVPTMKKILLSI